MPSSKFLTTSVARTDDEHQDDEQAERLSNVTEIFQYPKSDNNHGSNEIP
jgi:ATP phosphoribosyltransferase regulatory subunit HisZ